MRPLHALFTSILLLFALELFAPTIRKELSYDKYTLETQYTFNKEVRTIQWAKVDSLLDSTVAFEQRNYLFGTLKNYKNRNGVAPLAHSAAHDKHNVLRDAYGIARYQGIPLYHELDLTTPQRYARDGSLVAILSGDSTQFARIEVAAFEGVWYVPRNYLHKIGPVNFQKAIFIDRHQQHIVTLERGEGEWLVRSINPATTGIEHPPYKGATPLGTFVVQDKTMRMEYYGDGTTVIEGFSPFACRFTGGAYLHGVPVNDPDGKTVEYSPTLGTTPRSHMCVRLATSHAQFIYNWVTKHQALVFVYD